MPSPLALRIATLHRACPCKHCEAWRQSFGALIDAELKAVREALERIANHDGDRWIYDDDGIERQASPQEIAVAALRDLKPEGQDAA